MWKKKRSGTIATSKPGECVNEQLAEEMHKLETKNFKRSKFYVSLKGNIWAEIKLLSSKIKNDKCLFVSKLSIKQNCLKWIIMLSQPFSYSWSVSIKYWQISIKWKQNYVRISFKTIKLGHFQVLAINFVKKKKIGNDSDKQTRRVCKWTVSRRNA